MVKGPGSAVIYQGPSAFDGQPIVAVVTGLRRPSKNPKTGPMAQVWVLRADVNPVHAGYSRQDYAVCGDCPFRSSTGQRGCYVTLAHGPLAIWKRYRKGGYPTLEPSDVNELLKARGLAIRLGAYGEMTALPLWVTRDLVQGVRWTGYTHQWRDTRYQGFKAYLMASVESQAGRAQAMALGWRIFRVRGADESAAFHEIRCPASAEMGHRTTCAQCGLCSGTASYGRGWDVTIVSHGVGARWIPLEVRR